MIWLLPQNANFICIQQEACLCFCSFIAGRIHRPFLLLSKKKTLTVWSIRNILKNKAFIVLLIVALDLHMNLYRCVCVYTYIYDYIYNSDVYKQHSEIVAEC